MVPNPKTHVCMHCFWIINVTFTINIPLCFWFQTTFAYTVWEAAIKTYHMSSHGHAAALVLTSHCFSKTHDNNTPLFSPSGCSRLILYHRKAIFIPCRVNSHSRDILRNLFWKLFWLWPTIGNISSWHTM